MDNTNFVTAVVLSVLILVGFHFMYEKPMLEREQHLAALEKKEQEIKAQPAAPVVAQPPRERQVVVAETKRVRIETPELRGSINLKGARLDDLELVKYHETVDPASPEIVLLSPAGSEAPNAPYYTSLGWLSSTAGLALPTDQTEWKAEDGVLSVDKPVRLTWDNGQGLTFERTISLDENFMFSFTDRVKNTGSDTATLYPYGSITRQGMPRTDGTYVLHEGPIGALGGALKEYKYKTLAEDKKIAIESDGGWLGITDKYWLVSLIPSKDEKILAGFSFEHEGDEAEKERGTYQVDFRGTPVSLAPGASSERTVRLFAGAKRVSLLDDYEKKYDITLFDRAIDFGWYYFLTKPFLYLLDFLNSKTGNMGIAIVLFTIALKLLTLPLSLKSSRSMAKMRTIQPEMKKLQERFKDDRNKLGIETMELYKRENIHPMSGCFPILIQIPIFFALYKVLYVGIEMRHAPLFAWIKDMSAPDPTSVLTFFGAVDFSLIPHIGVWPILMGISMFVQQKMTPQPTTDNSQAQFLQWLPLIFTFMMGNVAVGLIFYWTVSNLLGIIQQWYINKKVFGAAGVK
ncbi:MAG: membrane protein insertase YidC [Alphaproteobacteria bacterium]|nr:membrane protein insertase YidC [Alphaproteobacteria bacterium]